MEFFCIKGVFFVIFLKSLLFLLCMVKRLDDKKISPISTFLIVK